MDTLKERCNVEARRWVREHESRLVPGRVLIGARDLSALLYSVIRPLEDEIRDLKEGVRT